MTDKKGKRKEADVVCPGCGVAVFMGAATRAKNCPECGQLVER